MKDARHWESKNCKLKPGEADTSHPANWEKLISDNTPNVSYDAGPWPSPVLPGECELAVPF